jgi:phenylacetate-coenzyme A ligase PaaK-like adenylate-forming protein
MIRTQNIDQIFYLTPDLFKQFAFHFYEHQAINGAFYQQFISMLGKANRPINALEDIPFLPIRFFKNHQIITSEVEKINPQVPAVLFESSGTTGQINSKHLVQDVRLYEKSFTQCFNLFYGDIQQYCILALLPSYLEKSQSSLVYMANHLMQQSKHPQNHFYLYEHQALAEQLKVLQSQGQQTLLIGVTYALLDFAARYSMALQHTQIIETGGMKGRKNAMIREDVHEILKEAFALPAIQAEYGMTELLSQAYSMGNGIFKCPPWMTVLVRDFNDPLQVSTVGKGCLNIIDLANIHSCCFIATDDIGEVYADGTFKVLGRLDHSDLRGCSLMYEG